MKQTIRFLTAALAAPRLLCTAAVALWRGSLSAQAEPLRIGLREQLFVDDYVVAERTNVTRELDQVTTANGGQPLIVADQPGENADLFRLGSVIRDGDKFRMWYLMNDRFFGYAESEDGLHWTQPALGCPWPSQRQGPRERLQLLNPTEGS